MSMIPKELVPSFQNGYYDDNGVWQKLKHCLLPCPNCDCGPPGGYYFLSGEALEEHLDNINDNKIPRT